MLETCAGRSIAHARNRGVVERHENESSLIERERVVIYSHRACAQTVEREQHFFIISRPHLIYFFRVYSATKSERPSRFKRVLAPRKRCRNGWRSASERARGTGADVRCFFRSFADRFFLLRVRRVRSLLCARERREWHPNRSRGELLPRLAKKTFVFGLFLSFRMYLV